METDRDMEVAKDQLTDLADELTYNGPLTPADSYFICHLLSEYYSAESTHGTGNKHAVDFAWDLAHAVAEQVDKNPQFDWIHAYFVGRSQIDLIRRDCMDYTTGSARENTSSATHFSGFADGDCDTARTLSESANDLVSLTQTYVDFNEPTDADIERSDELGIFFRHLSKRYAHEFESDMAESIAKMDSAPVVKEYMEDDEYSPYDLLTGGRFVEQWLEERAKEVHHALVGAPSPEA